MADGHDQIHQWLCTGEPDNRFAAGAQAHERKPQQGLSPKLRRDAMKQSRQRGESRGMMAHAIEP